MIHRSRNGSRIPNPFADNAQPGPGCTWATIDGRHVQVTTRLAGSVMRTPQGPFFMFLAQLESGAGVGYGRGPSHAIAELDKLLSQELTPAHY